MKVQTSHRLSEGTILDGRYEIGSVLGEGGFGITYNGRNRNTGARVAIKEFFCREYMGRDTSGTGRTFLIEETADRRFASEKRRFMREARIIRDYGHEPGIVTVLDYFEENDTAYIVMEKIEGEDLRSYVRSKGKIDSKTLFTELHPLMQSLQILHRAGVIHRDISPDNIIRTTEGRMVLIDFGSAKNLSSETRSATMTVKDGYTPPEQYMKGAEPSVALDIYALSATIYYCLTGFVPQASIQRVLLDELEPVSSMVMLPKEISSMITAGMSLKAEERPKDIGEMLEVIDSVYTILSPEEKARRRKRKKMIAAAVIALVVLGAGFGASHIIKNIAQYRMMMQSTIVTHYKWDNDEDMKQTKKLLKDRVEAFAGRNHYLFTDMEDEVIVEIPTAMMGEVNPEDIITSLFKYRCSDCSICMTNEQGYPKGLYYSDDGIGEGEEWEFSTADIDKMKVSSDPIPIGNDSSATIRHLTITFNNHASKEETKMLSRQGELLAVAIHNYDIYYHAFSAGDGRTLFLVDDFASNRQQYDEMINCALSKSKNKEITVGDSDCGDIYGVIKNNFEEKPESYSSPDFNNELIVNWDQSGGKYQCAPDEIKGAFMLLAYDPKASDIDEGDEAKNITAFRNRLDALQIPYAFGRDAYHEHRFIIKVKKDSIKQSETMLLGDSGIFEITNGYHDDSVHVVERQNDGVEVDILYDEEILEKIVAQNKKYNIDHVYLCYDDMPIAITDTEDLASAIGKETMLFTDFCTEGIDKDKARQKLHEDFIVAVDQNDMANTYELSMDNLEVHYADGSYKEQGTYKTFDGTCYKNELELMDRIKKEKGGKNAKVGANYHNGELSLVIDVSNIKTEGFAEQVASFVKDCLKNYSFYDTDIHFNDILFDFSNKKVKDEEEDWITASVKLYPDTYTMTAVRGDENPDSLKYTTYCYLHVYDSQSRKYIEDKSNPMDEKLTELIKSLPQLELE